MLSNGHLAVLTHDIYPEVTFYNREREKLDSISAYCWPADGQKNRYSNIADMAPLSKARLALLDSALKQVFSKC